jgi:hypothetical protein
MHVVQNIFQITKMTVSCESVGLWEELFTADMKVLSWCSRGWTEKNL